MDRRAAIGRALRAREKVKPDPAFLSLTDDEQANGLSLFSDEDARTAERHQTFERTSDSVHTGFTDDRVLTHVRPPALPEPGNVLVWQVPVLAAMLVGVVAVFALISTTTSSDQPLERNAAAHDVVLVPDVLAAAPPSPILIPPPAPRDEPSAPDDVAPAVVREAPRVRPAPPTRVATLPSPRPVETRPVPAPAIATVADSPAAPPASLAGEPGPAAAVPAAVPSAVPPAVPAVRPPPPESAVQTVLSRYRAAYDDLDAGAARAVWPSVDQKALSKAFGSLEHQQVIFDSCEISVTGARAVASCSGVATYIPRVGNKARRDDRRQWDFRLRRVNDAWLIDTVSAR
jgi:hypothetical protein